MDKRVKVNGSEPKAVLVDYDTAEVIGFMASQKNEKANSLYFCEGNNAMHFSLDPEKGDRIVLGKDIKEAVHEGWYKSSISDILAQLHDAVGLPKVQKIIKGALR